METENLLDIFKDFLASEKNASHNTIAAYERDIRSFIEFMNNQNKGILNATSKDVRKWLAGFSSQGLKRTSVSRKLSSLKSFFKFLLRSGITQRNPAEPVTFPIRGKPLPKSLTTKEIFKVLDEETRKDFIGVRDRAIMELLYSTGIRVGELVGLNIEDINFDLEILKVKGKGNKERIAPFGSKAKKALMEYLRERQILADNLQNIDKEALFLNNKGGRLTARSVQRMVSRRGLKLSLNAELTPHKFRHSMATHLLENGADLRSIQKILGHANIGTTQIYTNLDTKKLREIFQQAHPRSRKKQKKD